ncbi:DUF1758 domain-containing protein [Trichonephila clavipes]|nr:DUF1758 domain-containing protein [Trichonephila clavipes]
MSLKMQESLLYSMQRKAENKLATVEAPGESHPDDQEEANGEDFWNFEVAAEQRQWLAEKTLQAVSFNEEDKQCCGWNEPQGIKQLHVSLERIRKRVQSMQQNPDIKNMTRSLSSDDCEIGERVAAVEFERKKLKNKLMELQEKKKMNDELLQKLSFLKDAAHAGISVFSSKLLIVSLDAPENDDGPNFASASSKSSHSAQLKDKKRLANDDEIEGYILEKQELLDTWEEMLILLERRVSHLNKTNKSTEVIHTRNSDSTEIKLPTLSLPTFSGVIDEWLTFSDLFQAAVTNNQNLTGAQKLQYLKGVLKGDAQKIVQSLPITDGFDSNSQVLLCTALVNVCDSFGGTRLCRVLLDPGSQACLITSSCLERLGLPRKRTNVRISCLGASDTRTNALPMLKGQSLSFGDNKPFAVRSDLGWIVAGNVPSEEMFSSIAVNSIQVVTDELVSNFWKLDSVPEANLLTSEERACEDHFLDTHVRNEDGRYVVRLPFHSSPSKLGDSRESAIRRFKSLEHSLIKKPAIYSQYRDFMQEYLTLGHMELVPKNDYAKREAYYLPHHAVLRDSSTTKLRVVFDASAKSTSGYSLNDILMVGPRVQRDVYPILLSFRTFQIAVCADLEKMFRQIRISSEDTNWQRILWRDNPKEETVKEYRLTTVTYGTSCAPYLSTRTLTQLAFDERERYPLASFATLHHFYVDDLLSGAATEKKQLNSSGN